MNADAGRPVSVRISFNDDAGHDESLTSAGMDIPVPPLTANFDNVPSSHGATTTTFKSRLRFNVEPVLGYVIVRDDVLTVASGDVDRVQRADAEGDTPGGEWKIFIESDDDGRGVISITPTTDSTVCTSDGRKLSNSVSVVVAEP